MPCRVKTPVCCATSCGVPRVDAAADAGVLALGVLADADHVDVGRRRGWPAASSARRAAASAAG